MVRVNLTSEQIEVALQIANAITNSAGVPVSTGQRAINMLKVDSSLSGSASCIPTSEAVQRAIDVSKDEIIAAVESLVDRTEKAAASAEEFAAAADQAAQRAEDAVRLAATIDVLHGAVITATGDSITAQERNFSKLIAEEFGMTYENVARGGATIASGIITENGGHRACICDTISSMRQDADIILLSGGVNDQVELNHSREFLGELTEGFDQTLNKATLYGALEYMLRQAVYKWSNKTILYVLPHRMTRNLDYRTAVLRACEKYGVPVVDIMESTMDFYTLQEFKDLYTSDGDGWHPNESGFRAFYVPRIVSAVRCHFRGKGETVSIEDSNRPEVICVNTGVSASETFTPDIPGFVRSTNGSISTSTNYLRTDYLPLAGKASMEYNVFISGGSDSNHSTWALFDENKVWIASSDDNTKQDFWHTGPTGNTLMIGFKHNEISLRELLASYPAAAYVVFSTYVAPDYETIVDKNGVVIGWGSQEAYIILKDAE